jgi:transcriptional regulator with XRE-family HTH domain
MSVKRGGRDVDERLEAQLAYEQELLTGEAADVVAALLDSSEVSQRELAKRLGVSEARISQIVSGTGNLTLGSLATAGWALGIRFKLVPIPIEDRAATPAADDGPPPRWLARMQSALLKAPRRTRTGRRSAHDRVLASQ